MCNGLVVALGLLVLTNCCTPLLAKSMETAKAQDHLLKRALLWCVQPPVETERFGELSGSPSNPNSGFQQRDPNRSWFNQNKFLSDFLSLHPEAPFFSSSCYPSYVPFTSLISN